MIDHNPSTALHFTTLHCTQAIRSKGLPFIAIKRASAVCLENVVYIDEKSYLGRWPQPFVRDFILEHCNVTAAPLRPNTALM